MHNEKAIIEWTKIAESLSDKSAKNRTAVILIPSSEGFDLYEVSEETAKYAIHTDGMRKEWNT